MFVTFLIFLLLIFGACIKVILWVYKQNNHRREVRQRRSPFEQDS